MAIKEMQQLLRENPSLKAVDIDPDWASEFYDHAKRCSLSRGDAGSLGKNIGESV